MLSTYAPSQSFHELSKRLPQTPITLSLDRHYSFRKLRSPLLAAVKHHCPHTFYNARTLSLRMASLVLVTDSLHREGQNRSFTGTRDGQFLLCCQNHICVVSRKWMAQQEGGHSRDMRIGSN
jgi:hypothetical protein